MSINAENISFIIGIIGIVGAIFTIYHYFKNPQIKEEKTNALQSQAMKFMQESNDSRFKLMQQQITDAMSLATNHIHTVDTKVEALSKDVRALGLDVAKLGTIIEERIPKK